MRTLLPALLAGIATVVGVAGRLGLLGGVPRGAADNADGARLYCVAGLRPDTPEGTAAWRGVVVTEFTTGHPSCGPPVSSAARILAATVGDGTWSLTTLGWTYVVLLGVGAAVAAGALAVVVPRRALLVAIPLLPLVVVPWWSRFTISTYGEPAGLLGAVWLLLGLLVVVGSPPTARGPRLTGMVLVGAGGLVAATAKPGYVPLGLLAVGALVLTAAGARPGWRARVPGAVAAVLVAALAAGPVATMLAEQQRTYGAVNTHHLVFTVLLPGIGPEVLPRIGLPPEAAAHSRESFYWAGARSVPGWDAAIGERPEAARADAQRVLAEHPGVALRALGRALSATLAPQLAYLPSTPRGAAPERDELRTIWPETGPVGDVQQRWFEGLTVPWLPSVLAAVLIGAGLATLLPGRRRAPSAGLLRVAAAAAGGAVAMCALAVAGDGLYELTKHVWLASYLLVVAAAVAGAAAGPALLRRRPPWTPGRPRTGAGTDR